MNAYWYADTAPVPAPRASVRTMSKAIWLEIANPTVQPESRSTDRTAGCLGRKSQRSEISARRSAGISVAAIAATPAVVPMART
ncbi:unannotated protein [freshwater metagenome]|uniref:Unannotated protein n=1 Tax=freshwater metagenome TaxID=449393 RepID=A0A6J7A543_9ZZZZ